MSHLREWFGSLFLVSFSEKSSCLSTSGHSASKHSRSRSYGCYCQALWWYFRHCRGVGLFATVRGTFKCLYWLARGRALVSILRIFPHLRRRIASISLIHNNIHNLQIVIHKSINIHKLNNIHESTLFEILPGGNTCVGSDTVTVVTSEYVPAAEPVPTILKLPNFPYS